MTDAELRPLRHDSRISDPDLLLGARLLAHTQPLPKSEARKRRVWNALGAGHPSRLGFRLTALRVAFASVLFAAVSSAAVGHYYVEHRPPVASVEQPPSTRPVAPHRTRSSSGPRAPVALPVDATPPDSASVASNADMATAGRQAPARALRRPAPSDADAELLVEAMRARSAGDAARVSQLVDEYRAKHPQGVLQEEALILSIDSAVARHAPNAAALAREYLTRFPNGRFATQARRVASEDAR